MLGALIAMLFRLVSDFSGELLWLGSDRIAVCKYTPYKARSFV